MRRALATQLGTLWFGCAEDLLASLPDGSVDLVVADPPYNLAKEEWDDLGSLDAYVSWCDTWLAEVERVLTPAGSAYVCGFSEILAEVKARSARRFRGGCRWLVWYYRNKANLGHDWGRSHESILHLRQPDCLRIDVDAVRVPYNRHTERYPERVQAVSSQYGRGVRRDRWQPHPLGAKPRDVLESRSCATAPPRRPITRRRSRPTSSAACSRPARARATLSSIPSSAPAPRPLSPRSSTAAG